MPVYRPHGLLSGFHAEPPLAEVAATGLVHAGEQWAPEEFSIGAHRHPCWELYLQLHGTARWGSAGQVFPLGPGHVLAVPPGREHALLGRPSARHHYVYAAVDLRQVATRLPTVASRWHGAECVHLTQGEPLGAPFRQLVREVASDLPHREAALAAAVDLLLITATRLRQGAVSAALEVTHAAVRLTLELLEEHYDRPWTLTELAARAGVSPNHLVTVFTREVGEPPHRHLLRLRIERAQELLAGSDLPVTALAGELGFGSSQHLARAFRARVGCAPREWRRRARGAPPAAAPVSLSPERP